MGVPFPGSALFMQLLRQLIQPASERVVAYAAQRPIFRRWLLVIPGRIYHRLDHQLNHVSDRKLVRRQPIKDEEAAQIGSQLMIEVVIFALLVVLMALEGMRSQQKIKSKKTSDHIELLRLMRVKDAVGKRLHKVRQETKQVQTSLRKLEKSLKQ